MRTEAKAIKLLAALVLCLSLAACSGFNPLSALTGGGVNTAANVQAGRENTQTIGVSTQQKFAPQSVTVSESSLRPQGRPSVEQVQNQTNNELPTWIWIFFLVSWLVGWLTDTPATIISRYFK